MFSTSGKLLWLTLLLWCAACRAGATPAPTPTLFPYSPSLVATGTASAVPPPSTQTATPAAAPRDFTESFDGETPFWSYLQVDTGQPFAGPGRRDGFLVFDLPAPDQWAYAFYAGHNYTDVTIAAAVQDRTGGDGAAGVLCRYDEKKGWYELNVFGDGTYQLLYGRWLAAGVAAYTPLYRAQAGSINSDSNVIALECRGNMLTPFINQVQQRRWQELKFGLQTGGIGLAVSSFESAPFTIAFDSVTVSEP